MRQGMSASSFAFLHAAAAAAAVAQAQLRAELGLLLDGPGQQRCSPSVSIDSNLPAAAQSKQQSATLS